MRIVNVSRSAFFRGTNQIKATRSALKTLKCTHRSSSRNPRNHCKTSRYKRIRNLKVTS
ncbi:hypothetical protein D3C79_1092510 [compost metagenome]